MIERSVSLRGLETYIVMIIRSLLDETDPDFPIGPCWPAPDFESFSGAGAGIATEVRDSSLDSVSYLYDVS